MIRTALIYLLTDKCIDRIFDSVDSVLSSSPKELKVGMWLKWVQYNEPDDSIKYDALLNHVVVTRISGNIIVFAETPETEYYTRTAMDGNSWVEMALPEGLTQTWMIRKHQLFGWEA